MSVSVAEAVWQAAHLRAFSPVGASPCGHESGVAVAAVAHAQCPVHECFERHGCGCAHGADFLKGKFAGEHYLRESCFFKKGRAAGRACVALCAGVQGYRRQRHAQICHVLHDECVCACVVEFSCERFGACCFIIV